MISLKPLTARALSRLHPRRPIDWPGHPYEVIAPATVLERSSSIALPEEYERIAGVIEGCSIKEWLDEARGGPQVQPETRRYDLGRSIIADGTVYYNKGYEVIKSGDAHLLARGRFDCYDEMQLASISDTEKYFGHWLTDTSMMLLLAEQTGTDAVIPWTSAATAWPHRSGYEQMLRSPFRQPRLAIVNKLWAVDDRPRNGSRAARLREVRSRFRHAMPKTGKPRVVISRGLSGARRLLVNESEIVRLLAQNYDFDIVEPNSLSPSDIVNKLANADVVIGVEGSHLLHAVTAANDNALIFAIMPPRRFSPALKWYTDMIGMRFGFVVADQSGEDMHLPLERLVRSIDNIGGSL